MAIMNADGSFADMPRCLEGPNCCGEVLRFWATFEDLKSALGETDTIEDAEPDWVVRVRSEDGSMAAAVCIRFAGMLPRAEPQRRVQWSVICHLDDRWAAERIEAALSAPNDDTEPMRDVHIWISGRPRLQDRRPITTSHPYVATVHRPGLDDVHIGFDCEQAAQSACHSLTSSLRNCTHVPGTTITWSLTPEGVTPLGPLPTYFVDVALQLDQEDYELPYGHAFPDVHARLKAQIGDVRAYDILTDACTYLATLEAAAENGEIDQ